MSEGMKWLQGTWVRRFNGFRNWTGRPFQARYKGILVEPGHVFGQVCHYIHLNPVRARIVPAEKVGEYRWSRLPRFEKKSRPWWLESSTVLAEAGGLADTSAGWKKYREYLIWLATDEMEKKKLTYLCLPRCRPATPAAQAPTRMSFRPGAEGPAAECGPRRECPFRGQECGTQRPAAGTSRAPPPVGQRIRAQGCHGLRNDAGRESARIGTPADPCRVEMWVSRKVPLDGHGGSILGWDRKQTRRPTTLMVVFHFQHVSIFKWNGGRSRRLARALLPHQRDYLQALGLPESIFITPVNTIQKAKIRTK